MKKNRMSKLTLSRETLRNLEDNRLRELVGRGPTEWTACRDCATQLSDCCYPTQVGCWSEDTCPPTVVTC